MEGGGFMLTVVHSTRRRIEHQFRVFAPLREFLRKIVIQQGTCGNFHLRLIIPQDCLFQRAGLLKAKKLLRTCANKTVNLCAKRH